MSDSASVRASRVTLSIEGTISSSQTTPLVEKEAKFQNTYSPERTIIWSWVPMRPDTKKTLLTRASSNLLNWTEMNCKLVQLGR